EGDRQEYDPAGRHYSWIFVLDCGLSVAPVLGADSTHTVTILGSTDFLTGLQFCTRPVGFVNVAIVLHAEPVWRYTDASDWLMRQGGTDHATIIPRLHPVAFSVSYS
ncbi:hypothetical protein BaRGS_00017620, partial [Batillaria attramentaria]